MAGGGNTEDGGGADMGGGHHPEEDKVGRAYSAEGGKEEDGKGSGGWRRGEAKSGKRQAQTQMAGQYGGTGGRRLGDTSARPALLA